MVDTVKTKVKSVFSSIKGALLKPFKMFKGGAVGGIFKKVGGMLFKLLKPVLKRIPGIGSMISWAFAVSRFKSGDVVGGLIDVASGIATLFPGIGTAIGIGLDVLNAFLDSKKGKEEKVKPAGSGFKMSDFFGKIKDKIMNNFPIKNLVEFWTGAGMVMSGNFKEGFSKMAFAIPFMKPLSDWLFGAPDTETGERSGGAMVKIKSFGPILKKALFKKMKAGWSSLPKWAKTMARRFMPDSLLSELDDGEGTDLFKEENEAQNAAESARVAPLEKAKQKYGRKEGEVGTKELEQSVGMAGMQSAEALAFQKAKEQLTLRRKELMAVHSENKPGFWGHTKKEANAIKGAEASWAAANLQYQKAQRAFRDAQNKPEMQDYVMKDGEVMPFSNQDSVLGMKQGGPIDQLVNTGAEESRKLNQQLITLAAEQTQLLREIAFNTKGSQAQSASSNAGGNIMQGSNEQSALSQLNIRKGFTEAYS